LKQYTTSIHRKQTQHQFIKINNINSSKTTTSIHQKQTQHQFIENKHNNIH